MIIEGQDWKEIKPYDAVLNLIAPGESPDDTSEERLLQNQKEYFPRYFSLFGHEPSSYNLGIYQKPFNDKETLWATKYVGVMPLMKMNGQMPDKSSPNEIPIVKIFSRFHISPTEMLQVVISGDDYYENPEILKTRSYSLTDWRMLAGRQAEDKVLFGLLNGAGTIELSVEKSANNDLAIADTFGVFEIIDFVNKAKIVCKKSLKKQSQKVEENLCCKVKGRILVQKQIKYNVSRGRDQMTYCSYNRMSENIRENQIIKYALHLCQTKHGIGDSLAEDIRFCLGTLNNVPLKKVSSADFTGLKNNGAFRQYKDALYAARKIIGRYGISYDKDSGDGAPKVHLTSGKVLPHFIDMNLLFEYYCRALFRLAIELYNKGATSGIFFELESSKKAKRKLLSDNRLDSYFMKEYIPDIVIQYKFKNGKTKFAAVFDAKYSDVKEQKGEQRSRTHQVLFYMKALGCGHGGLISPHDGEVGKFICSEIHDLGDGSKLYYIPLDNPQKNDTKNAGSNNKPDNDDSRYKNDTLTNSYVKYVYDLLSSIAEDVKKQEELELEQENQKKLYEYLKNKAYFDKAIKSNQRNTIRDFYPNKQNESEDK